MPRAAAAAVASICWAGLGVQYAATYANVQDVGGTLWILLRFFTVLTNLLVALAMTAIALGRRVPPFWQGALTLAILLVGIVYITLLRGLVELSGGAILADALLHRVSPIATALYWLMFAPHRQLKWSNPLWWSLYPLAYFGYALTRGGMDGRYPYPFMDVGKLGVGQTALNAAAMALCFIVAGVALVWLDRRLPLGSASATD